jgi:hypothetical protein
MLRRGDHSCNGRQDDINITADAVHDHSVGHIRRRRVKGLTQWNALSLCESDLDGIEG